MHAKVAGEAGRELERMARLYNALSSVNQAIVWTHDRDRLFHAVCAALVEKAGFAMVWIGWNDPDTCRLMPVARAGAEASYVDAIRVYTDDRPEGRGPSGTAFREGRTFVMPDILAEPSAAPWREQLSKRGFHASAVIPIREGGEVRGTLNVYASEARAFQDREVSLLNEVATDLSFGLDNLAREADRERAHAAAENERRFSAAMIESMPGVVYFYDQAGRFLRWNRNFEVVSGYSGAEIAQMHPLDFFESPERERVAARIGEVLESGESHVEANFVSKDKTRTPYFFTGRRVSWEGIPCLVGMGIDISEKKRSELALLASNVDLEKKVLQRTAALDQARRFLDAIIDHLPDAVFYKDAELRFLGANRAYEQAFGVRREDLIGKTVLELEYLPEADRRRYQDEQLAVISTGVPIRREAAMPFSDQREHQTLYSAQGIHRDDGSPVGVVASIVDITPLKETEAALAQAKRDAEAADRLKSAFLATMSHELRTPLNSIIGFTGILLQGLAGTLNDEQKKQMGMVRGSARHLLDLINDVLDISKIEAGQMTVRSEPFELAPLLERVVAGVRPLADRKHLGLCLNAPPSLPRMVSDERRVEQILINLLNNAVKFTEQGTVTLEAKPLDAQHIRLRVIDTGEGIRPEDQARLFQPFTQIDTGLTRKHEGTGLGLAICQRLATMLGGDISCASTYGEGSTFTVILPTEPRPS
jgi:PAS domain S-box-containing protein